MTRQALEVQTLQAMFQVLGTPDLRLSAIPIDV
jgi:hypothetical protein